MAEEKIIKKELVHSGIVPGYLILTPTKLYLEYTKGLFKRSLHKWFEISVDTIINVEATKDHFTTSYNLKIRYIEDGKEKEAKVNKSGWNPFKGTAAFKVEANLFNEWVKAIEDARLGTFKKDSVSELNELEKLAELKDKGIITQEEFDKKKKSILGI